MTDLDPNRPDGLEERVVRIETRLVKYQEQNMLHLQALAESVRDLQRMFGDMLERLKNGNTKP